MKFRAIAVIGLVALWATGARAGITTVSFSSDYSQHHLTSFEGVATYDSTTGKLNIAVSNTGGNGGYLTGIALSASGHGLSLADTAGSFSDARNHKGIVNAGLLGKYHAGATTGMNFSAGGRAVHGIADGASRVFTFQTTAADAGMLTVADFLSDGKTGEEIAARFKRIPHHGADRGGAVMKGAVGELFASQFEPVNEQGLLPQNTPIVTGGPTPQVTTAAIPLPSAAWMAVVTLALMAVFRAVYRMNQVV